MAVRTAEEITGRLRDIFGEQTPEGYVELLEDITDSVGSGRGEEVVSKADYDKVVAERDDMRSRYINRFYGDYSKENSKGYVEGEVSQETVEDDEKDISYQDLFE